MADHADIDHTGLTGVGVGDATAHIGDATDAHDASAISVADSAANFTGTDVEAVLAELQDNIDTVSAGSGIPSGTSNPAQPAYGNNVPFYRTDLGGIYFYDGTRWLSLQVFPLTLTQRTTTGAGQSATFVLGDAPMPGTGDIYVLTLRALCFISGANLDGSNNWTVRFTKRTTANAATTIQDLAMNSQTSGTFKLWEATVNAVVQGSAHVALVIEMVKTGSPASLFVGAPEVTYRLVAA